MIVLILQSVQYEKNEEQIDANTQPTMFCSWSLQYRKNAGFLDFLASVSEVQTGTFQRIIIR